MPRGVAVSIQGRGCRGKVKAPLNPIVWLVGLPGAIPRNPSTPSMVGLAGSMGEGGGKVNICLPELNHMACGFTWGHTQEPLNPIPGGLGGALRWGLGWGRRAGMLCLQGWAGGGQPDNPGGEVAQTYLTHMRLKLKGR